VLLVAALVGAVAGLVAGKFLPAWYESNAVFAVIPTEDPTMPTAYSPDMAPSLQLFGRMLVSRSALDETVRRLELTRAYGKATPQQARLELFNRVNVSTDRKANVVQLSVEDRVPARAQLIASTLGEAARALNMEMWSARSNEQRKALEARLAEVSAALKDSEKEMLAFRERERVFDLPEQVKASVAEAAFLERMKTEKKIGLHFAQGFGGAESPEVRRSQLEAGGASAALQGLVHRGTRSGPLLALDDLPRLQAEHARLKRDVDVNAYNYELLARQVEQFRAAETRPGGRAELVDAPIEPRDRSRPSRLYLAMEGMFLGLLFGLAFAVGPRARLMLIRPKHPVASVDLPL
jgi:uncharacterized protein involved in exopolysaccharide biosynthesis